MSTNTISLLVEITREADDSFAISLEDDRIEDDDRFVDGLSEGIVFDPTEASATAVSIVGRYIRENIARIEKPMEFKRAES